MTLLIVFNFGDNKKKEKNNYGKLEITIFIYFFVHIAEEIR